MPPVAVPVPVPVAEPPTTPPLVPTPVPFGSGVRCELLRVVPVARVPLCRVEPDDIEPVPLFRVLPDDMVPVPLFSELPEDIEPVALEPRLPDCWAEPVFGSADGVLMVPGTGVVALLPVAWPAMPPADGVRPTVPVYEPPTPVPIDVLPIDEEPSDELPAAEPVAEPLWPAEVVWAKARVDMAASMAAVMICLRMIFSLVLLL